MNERQLKEQDLYFTGIYNKTEIVKDEAKQIRKASKKLGYNVRIVTVSNYKSYYNSSLYANKEYFEYKKYIEKVTKQKNLLENKEKYLNENIENLRQAKTKLEILKQSIKLAEEELKDLDVETIIKSIY